MSELFQTILRTATLSWSPSSSPMYLSVGKLAGTLSEDFDTSGELEIFEFDQEKFSMEPIAKIATEEKFYRMSWSLDGDFIAGGMDNGLLSVWKFSDLLNNGTETIHTTTIHEGGVKGLDFNVQQPNLLVSGGGKGKIYVWDLANNAKKYNISDKNPAGEAHITCAKWNNLTAPVLASSSDNGTVALWDLRKNKSIHHFKEANTLYNSIAWSPVSQTILATASETDDNSVIKIWDLKFAKKPLAILEGHTDGVLSLSWSTAYPNLLLSGGLDENVFCWDVDKGLPVSDVCETESWISSVAWGPRPGLLSVCSNDIKLVCMQDFREPCVKNGLMQAPQWLASQGAVSFGFGGKIAYIGEGQTVHIAEFHEESELADRAARLTNALSNGSDLSQYCLERMENTNDKLWTYLNIILNSSDCRNDVIRELGFDAEEIKSNATKYAEKFAPKETETQVSNESPSLATEAASLFEDDDFIDFPEENEIALPDIDLSPISFDWNSEFELIVTNLLLLGDFEQAVNVCFNAGKYAEALILAAKGGKQLLYQTQKKYLASTETQFSKVLQLVVDSDWENMIRRSDITHWRELLAFCCTYADEPFQDLCNLIGDRLVKEQNDTSNAILCYICGGNIDNSIDVWLTEKLDTIDIIERVIVWSNILGTTPSDKLINLLTKTGEILANNGHLETAYNLLQLSPEIAKTQGELLNRLSNALGKSSQRNTTTVNVPSARPQSVGISPSVGIPQSVGIPPSVIPSPIRKEAKNKIRNPVPVVNPRTMPVQTSPGVFVPGQNITPVPPTGTTPPMANAPPMTTAPPKGTPPRIVKKKKQRTYQPAYIPQTINPSPSYPQVYTPQQIPSMQPPSIAKPKQEEDLAPPPKNASAPRARHRN